eukprot:TRINITY_DN3664_c0_g1_i5.p1 TRINITY_DN3664_c0_g1~~TRINITY_DN3664_c0_g1_i5.p1  ORF type:complete len:462 (+),score=128.11 TRINITY_DN3664_c0_g1_i5:868-2253(+)
MMMILVLAGAVAAQMVDPMCKKITRTANEIRSHQPAWVLDVDAWNATTKTYTTVGSIFAQAFSSVSGDFGSDREIGTSLHAANVNPIGHDETDPITADIFFGGSFTNKYYKIEGLRHSEINRPESTTAQLSEYAYGLSPASMLNVEAADGSLAGHLIAGGTPFLVNVDPNPVPGPPVLFKGSVAFLPATQSDSCDMLFPPPELDEQGKCINTAACHFESGVCLFTGWKFMSPSNVLDPDCLYSCILDDVHMPTGCVAWSIVQFSNGTDVCMTPVVPDTHFGGGPHSVVVGETLSQDNNTFEIVLLFTGESALLGPGGATHLEKLILRREGNDVITLSEQIYGEQLWKDTVETGYDVGLDKMWLQRDKRILWIITIRDSNAGAHAVDYASGDLLLSLHGFNGTIPDQYTYPAGISGYGSAGAAGSFLNIVCGTNNAAAGLASVVLIDISELQLVSGKPDLFA